MVVVGQETPRWVHSFATVRRGYDPGQVTAHLRRIEVEFAILVADRDAALEQAAQFLRELNAARREIERLSFQLPRLSLPPESIESMSERLQLMQRLARDEFGSMHAEAVAYTAEIIAAARAEARRGAAAVERGAVVAPAAGAPAATATTGAAATPTPTPASAAPTGAAAPEVPTAAAAGAPTTAAAPEVPATATAETPVTAAAGGPATMAHAADASTIPAVEPDRDRDRESDSGPAEEPPAAPEAGQGESRAGVADVERTVRRLRREAAQERARLHEAAVARRAAEDEEFRIALALRCREVLAQLTALQAESLRIAQRLLAETNATARGIVEEAQREVDDLHSVRAQLVQQLTRSRMLIDRTLPELVVPSPRNER
ncbi:hypothetical protein [Pseudonocardia sp. H11422]|uniref:hypothetical protein n=1 Tax=Pseudonocardia sp. H11422 TaxID=2835866 RepID=UPI00292FF6C7|nr:hypothetical protein [Pseudonocardia sp. H11422]